MSALPVAPEPDLWAQRWAARSWLWQQTTIKGIAYCGRVPKSSSGSIELFRYPSGQITLNGLQSCHSVWSCPVCSARIVNRRGQQLQTVIDRWHAEGYRIGFQTFTLRHKRRDTLEDTWNRVIKSFNRVAQGLATLHRNFGVVGQGRTGSGVRSRISMVRTTEATHGANGWHVHLHVLVFFDGGQLPEDRWSVISAKLSDLWNKAVVKEGGSVDPKYSTQAELVDPSEDSAQRVGEYLSKAVFAGSQGESAVHRSRISFELTDSSRKTRGGRTPWQILDDAMHGDERSAKLWTVWENVSRGRRQMNIATALLKRYEITEEDDRAAFEAADEASENLLPDIMGRHRPLVQGPPELVAWAGVDCWRTLDRMRRLPVVMLEWLSEPGYLAKGLRDHWVPVMHGSGPAAEVVTVSWHEWKRSFPGDGMRRPPTPPPLPPHEPYDAPLIRWYHDNVSVPEQDAARRARQAPARRLLGLNEWCAGLAG